MRPTTARKGHVLLRRDESSPSYSFEIGTSLQKASRTILVSVLSFILGFILTSIFRGTYPSEQQCTARLSVWCAYIALTKIQMSLESLTWSNFILQRFFLLYGLVLHSSLLRDTVLIKCEASLLEVVDYELRNVPNQFSQKSAFRGPPTAELEQQWLDIYECLLA